MINSSALDAPDVFWEGYREAFRNLCSWMSYKNLPRRTQKAMEAARVVLQQDFGLQSVGQWFRIDIIVAFKVDPSAAEDPCDRGLRVELLPDANALRPSDWLDYP